MLEFKSCLESVLLDNDAFVIRMFRISSSSQDYLCLIKTLNLRLKINLRLPILVIVDELNDRCNSHYSLLCTFMASICCLKAKCWEYNFSNVLSPVISPFARKIILEANLIVEIR